MVRILHRIPLIDQGKDVLRRQSVACLDGGPAGNHVQESIQDVAPIGTLALGDEMVDDQMKEAVSKQGEGDLRALLNEGDTWIVEGETNGH